MRHLEVITEHEMVAHFLKTEIHSVRFEETILALLQKEGKDHRVIDQPDLGNEEENAYRSRLLGEWRGYKRGEGIFMFVPDDTAWHRYALSRDELSRVRYIDYDYWTELSGGTRLAIDAAPRIRAGVAPFRVSSDWALGMARAVADGARFPPLILVTAGDEDEGGLVVLEGHARLTAFMLRPDALPPELEVLVGSSPKMAGWELY